MNLEKIFDKTSIIDLSFFNFENAITAAYYADEKFEIQKVNGNFLKFFPVLDNVTGVHFPDVLAQLGVPEEQVQQFLRDMEVRAARFSSRRSVSRSMASNVFSRSCQPIRSTRAFPT